MAIPNIGVSYKFYPFNYLFGDEELLAKQVEHGPHSPSFAWSSYFDWFTWTGYTGHKSLLSTVLTSVFIIIILIISLYFTHVWLCVDLAFAMLRSIQWFCFGFGHVNETAINNSLKLVSYDFKLFWKSDFWPLLWQYFFLYLIESVKKVDFKVGVCKMKKTLLGAKRRLNGT